MNVLDAFNDQQEQNNFTPDDISRNKVVVMIPYILPILFFLPIIKDKNSPYCTFHANQQLAWLVCCVIVSLVEAIIGFIPIVGTIVTVVLSVVLFIFSVLLMLSAGEGKAVRVPFFGSLFEIF